MGNTTSDSLDHSFKRLRLSQTEQLSLIQPSDVSPKRKTTSKNLRTLTNAYHIGTTFNRNIESPGLQSNNIESPGLQSDNIESPGLQPDNIELAGRQLDNIESPSLQPDNIELAGRQLDNIESAGLQPDNIELAGRQLDNIESAPLVNPILMTSDNIINQLDDDNDLSDEDLLCFMKAHTKSIISNAKNTNISQTPINAQIRINTSDANIIPELSDDDLMNCIKDVYSKTFDKRES
jgi:hypothetical protein